MDLEHDLTQIGLRKKVVKKAVKACTPLIDNSYTYDQVLDIAIEYIVGRYTSKYSEDIPFPYEPTRDYQWIHGTPPIYNVPFSCSAKKEIKKEVNNILRVIPGIDTYSNPTLYYHTTSWTSCAKILIRIDHTKGHENQDFGPGRGFYMSKDIEHALEWGEIKSDLFEHQIAILIFALPSVWPSTIKYLELEGPLWEYVTKTSRLDLDFEPEKLYECTSKDFMYGNMLKNTYDYNKKSNVSLELKMKINPITHSPPKKQLASKSYEGDKYLQKHILGVLYFKQ
jgi:hypothetical protein